MAFELRRLGRQKVRYDDANADNPIIGQLVLNGEKQTPSAATIAVSDTNGDEVLAATAMTVSGTLCSYDLDTTTETDFPLGQGYRADLAITVSGTVYQAHLMFDVVRFLFRMQIGIDQLIALDDGLRGMLHDGDDDFSALIVAVEDIIQAEVETHVLKEGRLLQEMILDYTRLAIPARYRMICQIWRNKGDDDRAEQYMDDYKSAMRAALASITYDQNQDGQEDAEMGGIQVMRLVR